MSGSRWRALRDRPIYTTLGRGMGSRIGSAFVLVGVIALTVYLLGFSVDQADSGLLLAGLTVSLLGLLLRRRSARRSKQQIGRFQTVRRLLGGTAEEE